jgi:cytochrome bd-type quinol oxidase subunit 2
MIALRQPSAFLPLLMSLAGLALILSHVAVSGGGREADEGTAARLWWLLMAAQLPVVAFFAIAWLPRAPRQALAVLAMQAVAVLANLATLRFFDL